MGEDTVTQVLRHVSGSPCDHASADIVERLDDFTEVFGVEPERQRRGPDQIAEKRGQLPPLAYFRSNALHRGSKSRWRHSRSQESFPLVKRQTDLAQIGLGQFADFVRTDTIGGEQAVEFAQTKLIERGLERIRRIGPSVYDHFAANPDENTSLQWNPASLLGLLPI